MSVVISMLYEGKVRKVVEAVGLTMVLLHQNFKNRPPSWCKRIVK